MIYYPREQLPSVSAIDPDAPQFLAAAAEARKQQPCPFGVRDTRRRHDHRQQQAQRIDQDMPLAPFDHLAAVIPSYAAYLGGLDALAVQTTSSRMFVSASLAAHLGPQGVVNALPAAIIAPDAKVMVDALPFRIVLGQHTPLAARNAHVQDRIDHLAHVQAAGPTATLCGGDQIFDTIPLAVGQIGGVCLCLHNPSVPYRLL